jgi:hypothetical protein
LADRGHQAGGKCRIFRVANGLPCFIACLKRARLLDARLAGCPLSFSGPNVPKKRDLPGDEYIVANATNGLWTLLDHLGVGTPPRPGHVIA